VESNQNVESKIGLLTHLSLEWLANTVSRADIAHYIELGQYQNVKHC